MPVTYFSGTSGIEAFSVAVKKRDWRPVAFSEIDPFACMVLHHHYKCGPPLRMPNPLCAPTAKDGSARAAAIKRVAKIGARDPLSPPNLGDFCQIDGRKYFGANVFVAGTPCQDFSNAGLKIGLAGARGNLTLEYVRIADEIDPNVAVWENVTGVLSLEDNAFGHFLGRLCGHGGPLEPPTAGTKRGKRPTWSDSGLVYGPRRTIAWRVLDAQYFGLAQRRKRVFVVACPRNGPDPAKILLEWEGMRRDNPPGQEPEKDLAPTLAARTRGGGGHGTDFECDGGLIAGALDSSASRSRGAGISPANITAACFGGNNTSGSRNVATALNACGSASGRLDFETETFVVGTHTHSGKAAGSATQQDAQCGLLVASALRAEGFDASEYGTGRQNLVVCPPLTRNQYGDHESREGLLVPCCDPRGRQKEESALSISLRGREGGATAEISGNVATALRASQGGGDKAYCLERSAVRRLTPLEWERLMGFPEGYTHISGLPSWRDMDPDEDPEALSAAGFQVRQTKKGKWRVNDPDGPRYKTLGNSKAVPVVDWLCERIEAELLRCGIIGECPKWCACHSSNIPVRFGSDYCLKIQERFKPEAAANA